MSSSSLNHVYANTLVLIWILSNMIAIVTAHSERFDIVTISDLDRRSLQCCVIDMRQRLLCFSLEHD